MNKSRNNTDPVDRIADRLGIRPLNARSVALSALLGSHPPELPVAALVALGTRFAIPTGTTRTALSRMATAGEVEVSEGRYRLTGRLMSRQREQDRGRTEPTADWDGRWWTVTPTADRRSPAERRRFRAAMLGARLGELRPDLWMRPANLPVEADLPDVLVVHGELTLGDPRSLTERLWDLPALETRAARLLDAVDSATDSLDRHGDEAIAVAFTTFAACLQFLRSEPQLPAELAPSPSARMLRSAYGPAEAQLQLRLRDLYRSAARSSPDGALSTGGP